MQVALNDEQAANQLIDRTTATRNPFDAKYSKVEDAEAETDRWRGKESRMLSRLSPSAES